jgi:hypothetical protein
MDQIDKLRFLYLQGYPTLMQIRMFWEGMAMKGTFLVNHKVSRSNVELIISLPI